MNKDKYLKCFSKEKAKELQDVGYEFLYENGGVFYFENNKTLNFSNNDSLKDTKFSATINF